MLLPARPRIGGAAHSRRTSTPLSTRSLAAILITCALVVFLFVLYQAHSRVEVLHGNTNASEMREINQIASRLEEEHREILGLIAKLEKEAEEIQQGSSSSRGGNTRPGGIEAVKSLSTTTATTTMTMTTAAIPPPLPPSSPPPPSPQPPSTSSSIASSLPEPLTFNSPASAAAQSTLIVCGTDGSGTRRVVDVLTELGVLMVSEDPETFDIHGDLMGGWPPVVKPIIQEARGLGYDPQQLSPGLHERSSRQLGRLLRQAAQDALRPTSYKLAVGGALPRPTDVRARSVAFGFKAPVAMTLAPYWAHLLPHFKLLHVVRDGRDIAFSANQGPVEKFYRDMYGGQGGMLSPPLMAVRLWSDWNFQLFDWASRRSALPALAAPAASSSFGYLALHSEDLVSSQAEVRFAALLSLARWVGSNATEAQVCCLALADAEYLGSHDRTDRADIRDADKHVASKYGKWRGMVRGDPRLGQRLGELGAAGLRALGYEPLRPLASAGARSANGFACLESVAASCPRREAAPLYNAAEFAVPGKCSAQGGTDYKGDGTSDLQTVDMSAEPGGYSPALCCLLCERRPGCHAFTVDVMNRVCFLKARRGRVLRSDRTKLLLSGDML